MLRRVTYSALALICLAVSIAVPAQASGRCVANLAGWIHWDRKNHQAILCDSYSINVVREIHLIQGEKHKKTLYLCKIPKNTEHLRYKFIRRENSGLPFYSAGAIDCLQDQIERLTETQSKLQRQIVRQQQR